MSILDRFNALNAPDPALKFRFYVYVPDTTDSYHCVVENITATFVKIPSKPRFNGGSNSYYPDTNDIDGLSITFYEAYDYRVSAWLSRWRALVVRSDGFYGIPSEYKKTIMIHAYNNNSENPTLKLQYSGCWPTDQQPFEFSYEDATGRMTVQAQFSVDNTQLA